MYQANSPNKARQLAVAEYCRKFGKVMGEAYFQVLAPIWDQCPDLKPEKMGGLYITKDEHYRRIYELVVSLACGSSS